MEILRFLKEHIKPDSLFMKSSLINSVHAANKKLMRIVTVLTLFSLLVVIFVGLIKCVENQYTFLFRILIVQLIITVWVFCLSFRKYKLYMGYVSVYGILFITLLSELQSIHHGFLVEQRVLFTNTSLILLMFVCSFLTNPRHVIILGVLSIVRIVLFRYIVVSYFLQIIFFYHIVIFSCATFGIFILFKKLYLMTYQAIIRNSIITQKNKKLNQLIDFKHDMMSMILHDIRNPLNNILFAAHETQISHQVSDSVQHILQIADNFIDVHRMEEGAIIVRPTYECINQTILSAIEQLKYMLQEKNNRIQLNIADSLWLSVDQQLIERVFINLFTNSIKHSLPNLLIVVNCEFLEDCIRFEIKNDGAPIHPDDINKVFDKFFSKDEITESSYKSKGLGLRFCKMVIDAHGGDIGLTTNYPKNGTSTWFTLPHLSSMASELPVNGEIIDLTNVQLTEQEKALIKEHVGRICQCEMYEIGSIMKILNSIAVPDSPNVDAWKDMLMDAVVDNNKVYFNELMELLD